jgi:cytochrome c oxidase cbb3-type subunit 2
MKYGPLIFFGIFLTLAASWCGLVLAPQIQIGRQTAVKIEETGEFYPPSRPGQAQQGFEIYRANGCIYCHSQQIRMEGFGADILRNWGQRRTVARDYLNDKPVMLGTSRTGPDLVNIGVRQTSAEWHTTHLYNPRIPSKGSIMPPFPFLFEQRKTGPQPSPDALKLSGEFAPPPGYEIVPRPEAKALIQYLLSLQANAPLPETK